MNSRTNYVGSPYVHANLSIYMGARLYVHAGSEERESAEFTSFDVFFAFPRVHCVMNACESGFSSTHSASSGHQNISSPSLRMELPFGRGLNKARGRFAPLRGDGKCVRKGFASARNDSAGMRTLSASMRKGDEAWRNISAGMRKYTASLRNLIAAARNRIAGGCAGITRVARGLKGFAAGKGASSSRPDREERWTESHERRGLDRRSAVRKLERNKDGEKIEEQRPVESERR